MARLPQLIDALAEHDGRDRVSLDNLGRAIREAGFITTTGRGSAAAVMSISDAANLLIGAKGSDTPKNAATAVSQFRTFKHRATQARYEELGIFEQIDKAETFGEAIEELIAVAPLIHLQFVKHVIENYVTPEIAAKASSDDAMFREYLALMLATEVGLDVDLVRCPNPSNAEIRVWFRSKLGKKVQFCWEYFVDVHLMMDGLYGKASPGTDLITRTVFFPTILALSQSIGVNEDQDHHLEGVSTHDFA